MAMSGPMGFEADSSLDQHDSRATGNDWAPCPETHSTLCFLPRECFPRSSLFLTGTGAGMGPLEELTHAPKHTQLCVSTSDVFSGFSLFLTGTGAGMGPLEELTHALKHI